MACRSRWTQKTGLEAHNDVMDFIDAQGVLRYRGHSVCRRELERELQPLAPPASTRWGQGIATYAAEG